MAASLKYEKNFYHPSALLGKLSGDIGEVAEVRKEYTRLRDIAQKRLKRMGNTMFSKTNTYKFNVKHYPKLKDIKSPQELAARLADLATFITDPYGTVTKQKKIMKQSITTLHEHNYKFVSEENYIEFGQFMEEYRDQHLDEIYDSGDAADAYGVVVKHKIDPDKVTADFEIWLENIELAKSLRRSKQSEGSYEKVKKRLTQKRGYNDPRSQ